MIQWISIKKQLPPDNKDIKVRYKHGSWDEGNINDFDLDDLSHWAELEPPEGE